MNDMFQVIEKHYTMLLMKDENIHCWGWGGEVEDDISSEFVFKKLKNLLVVDSRYNHKNTQSKTKSVPMVIWINFFIA